ncbi:MAG: YraN family protein, partial [Pirellulales bacterium]
RQESTAMFLRRLAARLLRKLRARRTGGGGLGPRGERAAAKFLAKLGYQIIARGRRSALGELDLVAVDGRTIVFVEVKTRRSHDAGHPAESITPEKQSKVTRAAVAYLKYHGLVEHRSRFDVVAVTWPDGQRKPTIDHYLHAFESRMGRSLIG